MILSKIYLHDIHDNMTDDCKSKIITQHFIWWLLDNFSDDDLDKMIDLDEEIIKEFIKYCRDEIPF